MQLSRKAIRARLSIVPVFVLRHSDLAAGFLLFALTAVTDSDLFRTEDILGSDAATQYYPFYYFLGESLRSGSIPGWNPYHFSGTPFAADPLSGWTYLPAMVLFTLFPLVVAVKGLMFSHLLLAGLSTYALARTLGWAFRALSWRRSATSTAAFSTSRTPAACSTSGLWPGFHSHCWAQSWRSGVPAGSIGDFGGGFRG